MNKPAVIIAAFFCASSLLASGILLPANADTPSISSNAIHFHLDAGFHISAGANHPYSDSVEETREESGLRIIAATAILIAIIENIHGRHVARTHSTPTPCPCQSPNGSASAFPTVAPLATASPNPGS